MAYPKIMWCVLILWTVTTKMAICDSNDDSPEHRQGRANGYMMKLYSGSKADPVMCAKEGFLADPVDCSVFYRCINTFGGKYTVYRFQCGPGTVFDPDTEICNHPRNTKRSECGGLYTFIDKNADNEIEGTRELPSPITTKLPYLENAISKENTTSNVYTISNSITFSNIPSTTNKYETRITNTNYPTTKQATDEGYLSNKWTPLSSSRTTPKQITSTNTEQAGEICTKDGFMGDSENCRKFYRCVSNNHRGYIRYEFLCSEPTIWDDDMQSCNHPWAVRRRRCGRGDDPNTNNPDDNVVSQPQNNYGNKITQPQINYNNIISNTTHSNIANYYISTTKPNSYVSVPVTTSITYNDETQNNYYDNRIPLPYNNHSNQYTQQTELTSIKTVTDDYSKGEIEKSTHSHIFGDDNQCTENGFLGDNNDCRKFYRCVGNGRGKFIKYEFTCSQGTVWDSELDACNYAWDVKECGGRKKADSQIKDINKEVSNTYESTSRRPQTSVSEQDTAYSNPYIYDYEKVNQVSPTEMTSILIDKNSSNVDCLSSGYFGDNNDCRKFVRCIADGRGGYTKYQYKCNEGTFWDPTTQSCNFVHNGTQCKYQGESNKISSTVLSTEKVTTASTSQSTTSKNLQTSTQKPLKVDRDSSTTVPMWSKPVTSSTDRSKNKSNMCESSGFIGDDNDCKKFYRCVDNGNGGFIQHEFTCGEGTVWDPNTEACNHAWATSACGRGLGIEKVTVPTPIKVSASDVSSNENTFINSFETTNSVRSTASDLTTSKTTKDIIPNTTNAKNQNLCTKSGFRGDDNDCNKFYRCVDNGNGGYIQYEFKCGDGTVWDPKIEACNHKWAVEKCGGGDENKLDFISNPTEGIYHSSYVTENSYTSVGVTPAESVSGPVTQSQPSTKDCVSEGFYPDLNDCRKFYRCVDNGDESYTKYNFTCSDGTVWDDEIEACAHEDTNTNCSTKHNANNDNLQIEVSTIASTQQELSKTTQYNKEFTPKENNCESEGLYADPNDCTKYYQCVNNGKKGFIKYDFSCADGTIWIQESQACDHSSGVTNCTPATSLTAEKDLYTKGQTLGTTPFTTTVVYSTTTKDQRDNNDNTECKADGFYTNKADCKHFYRCVYEENGKYSRYDFSCGEGTAWNENVQSCDHIDNVKSCSASNLDTQASSATQEPNEYSETSDESSTSPTSSSITTTQKPMDEDECKEEGFFGSSVDCKKFYRCVYDQNGDFTKYSFRCGEGTVWDQDVVGCNHPENVENLSCTSEENNQIDATSSTTIATSSSQTTTLQSTSSQSTTSQYTGSQSTTPQSTSSQSTTTQSTSSQPTTTQSTSSQANIPQSSSSTVPSSSTTVPNKDTSSEGNNESNKDSTNNNYNCTEAGFFADPNDCKKFYRCVDWDNDGDGFSIFHFECGEGTIWDPSITTCNHEDSVQPPRNCSKNQQENENVSEASTEKNKESNNSTAPNKDTTTEESEESNNDSTNNNYNCTEAGFFADPNDCKKFYRCVDWDNDGEGFSIFHFECGEGTIWDPSITTCNHEDSVYPPRNCSGGQQQNQNVTEEPTTTNTESTTETTTQPSPSTTTTKKPTTTKSTTQSSTTQKSTTTQKTTTTQKSTTQKPTTQTSTTQKSTTTKTTPQQTTTEQTTTTTTPESTTTTTTLQPTTTTLQSTTTTQSNTDVTSTESSSSESTTTTSPDGQSTSESTTTNASSETTTSGPTATTTDQTQTTTAEQTQLTTGQTTQQTTQGQESTTESQGSTEQTESSTSSSTKDCPETGDDEYLYVCPTSFRRHPKYCNLFYQCTEDEDTHESKLATFHCPNNTIYDESKVQCVEEKKADKKCQGEIAAKRRVKRLGGIYKEPIVVGAEKMACQVPGHNLFEKNEECSPAFLKCERTKRGNVKGFVYMCPKGYLYWSISRRCEDIKKIKGCKRSLFDWSGRNEIPIRNAI